MKVPVILALLCVSFPCILASDPDCEVIEHFTDIQVIDGQVVIRKTNLVQINNRDGEYFNPLYIHFNKKSPVSELKIQLESMQGKAIRVIRKKEIEVESAIGNSSFYEDDLVKKIELTHNSYPYRIRYSYTRTLTEYLSIVRWYPYIRNYLPTKHSRLTVSIPADFPMRLHQQNIDYKKKLSPEGRIRYIWEARDIDEFESEDFGPHYTEVIPYVHLVPEEFTFGVSGSQCSWESFGYWVYRLNEGRSELPVQEQEKVDQIVSNAASTLDTIRVLYHHLQDKTRYINVAIDIGGLQTHPASYVCKNGYGDCKSLTNYLYSQLKYLGIDSYYTLVNSGKSAAPVLRNFPSNQFNHVMLCVPLAGDTLWLECTDKSNPFGYIGSFTQNRYALIIDKEHSKLVKIPAMTREQVTQTRSISMNASAGPQAVAQLTMHLKGDGFEFARYVTRQVEEREKDDYVRRYLRVPETELLDWSIDNPHRDSSTMVLTSTFKARKYYSNMGKLTLIAPPAIKIPSLMDPEDRVWPVHIKRPTHQVDSLMINLQHPMLLESLPQDTIIQTTMGTYSRSIRLEENYMLMIRDFSLNTCILPAEDYEQLHSFLNAVNDMDKEKILIKKY
ncbi:MAG: DUF3857 domain-containing protein [Bacteroidota bacterium]